MSEQKVEKPVDPKPAKAAKKELSPAAKRVANQSYPQSAPLKVAMSEALKKKYAEKKAAK